MAEPLDPVVDAYLDGATISASLLVFMDFLDAPKRWWTEFGTLRAGGYDWQGVGTLVSIEGLEAGVNLAAPGTTFTLSGLDPEVVALVANARERVKGRRVRVYIQFFSVDEQSRILANLADPVPIWSGTMDVMRFSGSADQFQVTLTAEGLGARRKKPPFGRYSYADQLARFPGDESLRRMQGLTKKSIRGFPS